MAKGPVLKSSHVNCDMVALYLYRISPASNECAPEEYRACCKLWLYIIVQAIRDFKSRHESERIEAQEFLSSGRMADVCELAGIERHEVAYAADRLGVVIDIKHRMT